MKSIKTVRTEKKSYVPERRALKESTVSSFFLFPQLHLFLSLLEDNTLQLLCFVSGLLWLLVYKIAAGVYNL